MGIIFLLFVGFIIFIVTMSKKTNEELKHYSPLYMDYEDIEDEIMFHQTLCDDEHEELLEEARSTYYTYPSDIADDYENYYADVYDAAICGDHAFVEEMEAEFGDNWECEY